MNNPPRENTYLWNDLPLEERIRLKPYMMESQILHIHQCKRKAILAHENYMRELDDLINDISRDLKCL